MASAPARAEGGAQQIDSLVCELYGLTEEGIAIVEGVGRMRVWTTKVTKGTKNAKGVVPGG